MFIRNCWYVAGWDIEVPAEGFLNRTLLNEPVLLYRDTLGKAVALENRCCHRAAPLHLGRKEGDCVRCLYHGLKFDPSGACVEIPGQERIPDKVRVRHYPVVERDRLVWIWMGEPAAADPSKIADFSLNTDPAWRAVFGYLKIDADYRLILDNFLDLTHVGYVHVGTIGNAPVSDAKLEIVADQGLVQFRRTMEGVPPSPTFVKAMQYEGRIDRRTTSTWLPAGHFLNEVNAVRAGSTNPAHAIRFFVNNSLTPETETSTHYFYAVTRNFQLEDPAVGELLGSENAAAFQEDKVVIEEQQRKVTNRVVE